MTEIREAYQVAADLHEQLGDDAPAKCAFCVADCANRGDFAGAFFWLRVTRIATALVRQDRSGGWAEEAAD